VKFFLDTANLDEIRTGVRWGMVALAGSHIGAMPFNVMDMPLNHPHTDGLEQFLIDWRKTFQEQPAVR
jgi:hypothetical protein